MTSATNSRVLILAATLALCPVAAQSQQAGSVSARVGAIHVAPDVRSGDMSAPSPPGVKVDVDATTQLAGGITYMLTDNWSLDLPLGLPLKIKIKGDGILAGTGTLANAHVLPLTLYLQYRFGDAGARFRPYVGAAPVYAVFYKERGTATFQALNGGGPVSLSIKDKLGAAVQIGMTADLGDRTFIDAMVAKGVLNTTAHVSTGSSIKVDLNPLLFAVGVGLRF